jgi:hypothetical protein
MFSTNSFSYFNGDIENTGTAAVFTIIQNLRKKISNKIYILKGRTGSGKSTILVHFLFQEFGNVWSAQPRVVLTEQNSLQISINHGYVVGENIGYKTGGPKNIPKDKSHILFTTTKILCFKLQDLINDETKFVNNLYKVFIIDEVHEINIETIELLKIVKTFLNKYGSAKNCPLFIFTSATLDELALTKYLFGLSTLEKAKNLLMKDKTLYGEVKGNFNFDIQKNYIDQKAIDHITTEERRNPQIVLYESAKYYINNILPKQLASENVNKQKRKARDGLIIIPNPMEGIPIISNQISKYCIDNKIPHILVTGRVIDPSPSEKVIDKIADSPPSGKVTRSNFSLTDLSAQRSEHKNEKYLLIFGYSVGYSPVSDFIISNNEKERIDNEIKIIIASPVVETGLTIGTLEFILDLGLQQSPFYFPLLNACFFKTFPIDNNKMVQREGRLGRNCPGEVYHFYTSEITKKLPPSIPQTINCGCLSGIFIQIIEDMKIIDLPKINNYLFLPASIDVMIASGQDFMNSLTIGMFGELIKPRNYRKTLIRYFFHILKRGLLESCVLAQMNMRKMKTQRFSLFDPPFKPEIFTIDKLNQNFNLFDSIDIIKTARNYYTEITTKL